MRRNLPWMIILGLLVGMATRVVAEEDPRLAHAKQQAEAYNHALLAGDFNRMTELIYPAVVTGMGGRDKLIEHFRTGIQDMAAKGQSFQSVRVQTPTRVVRVDTELYTLIHFSLIMTVPGGRLIQESTLIGVSTDDGATWTFVDAAPLTNDNVTDVLPNFPQTLEIKPRPKPLFEPTQ